MKEGWKESELLLELGLQSTLQGQGESELWLKGGLQRGSELRL